MDLSLVGMAALNLLLSVLCGWLISAWRKARAEVADMVRARKELERLLVKERSEAYRAQVQLAGCGVAALGGIGPQHLATKGQYGWSASYQDVVDLRREAEALRQARDHAVAAIDDAAEDNPAVRCMRARRILEASKEAAALTKADRTA